jgi:hypothetical protein
MSKLTHNNEELDRDIERNGDDELRKRRIRKEIIRVDAEEDEESEDEDEEIEDEDVDDEVDDESDEEESDEEEEEQARPSRSIWKHIVTGGFITSDNASQYYRYLIAIAIMCFVSIFLTFMSLNADSEYRRKESELAVLRERSVLKSEERYRISSRDEVVRMLRERDSIEMVDQDNSQRM